jgi:hypothetical protein
VAVIRKNLTETNLKNVVVKYSISQESLCVERRRTKREGREVAIIAVLAGGGGGGG